MVEVSDKTLTDLLASQKEMQARLRELEERPEVERQKKVVPGYVSPEKRIYLKKLAAATAAGNKEPLRQHNAFVDNFFNEYGPDADWRIPNIF
ncbi:MAG: hypothetical protein KAV87_20965 [Desulfobacteraceae bacterium]|nr:hypothetical protein [Desulfobacteraceae bacterium]